MLCLALALALLAVVLWPKMEKAPEPTAHSPLKEAVARYGDEMAQERALSQHTRYVSVSNDSLFRADKDHKPAAAPKRSDAFVVELNSADTAQLRCLYGIGPVFAARIVKYRQLLGGYVRKEQLLEVYGMDEERYAGIAANVVLDTASVTKPRVNDLSIAELKRHPYLDYYQAKAIVDFRNGGRRYQSMDDLRLVSLIDDETATKLQGYIQFN